MTDLILAAAFDMNGIIIAAVVVGVTGIVIGIFLGIAGKKLEVPVDEKEVAVRAALPGNNCGGCGYAGCDGLAAAIAKGEAPVGQCPVGGDAVAAEIAAIMGVEASSGPRMVAFVKCMGDCDVAGDEYEYTGIKDCRMASQTVGGGSKSCKFGCLGFGTCVGTCEFDAIHIVNGVALVDKDTCKACGKCVEACPKHIIELRPVAPDPAKAKGRKATVMCSSHEKGKAVMDACKVGCIGCGLCVKECPVEAIVMDNNLPVIDYNKCIGCGKCAIKCPKKIISIS